MSRLEDLAMQIVDPESRALWLGRARAWRANQPHRWGAAQPCVACDTVHRIKKGTLCEGCMRSIISHQIARAAAEEASGVRVWIDGASHLAGIPYLRNDARVPLDASFSRTSRHNPGLAEGAPHTFAVLIHELALSIIQAFPSVPVADEPILHEVKSVGRDHAAAAPADIVKALRDLMWFVAWNDAQAFASGFEKGSSLLAGLAAGTLTNAEFSANTVREGEAQERVERNIADRRIRK